MLQSTRKQLAEKLVALQTEYERSLTMGEWSIAEDVRKQIVNVSDAINLESED
jgi:hypothetical protein